MRRLVWLFLPLLLAACRPSAPPREVRVVVSGPGRLARAEAFTTGLHGYDLEGVELTVCGASDKADVYNSNAPQQTIEAPTWPPKK